MAELDERLSRLLSDENGMKRLLELASGVMAGQDDSSSQNTQPQHQPMQTEGTASPPPAPDLSSVLNFLNQGGSGAKQPPETEPPSITSGIMELLPELLQALSGNATLLQGDRVNLIRAIQPYMSEARAGNIDRAVRMANLTKVARDFLKLMGR